MSFVPPMIVWIGHVTCFLECLLCVSRAIFCVLCFGVHVCLLCVFMCEYNEHFVQCCILLYCVARARARTHTHTHRGLHTKVQPTDLSS